MKRIAGMVLLLASFLVTVPSVLAGGWATVTVDELPPEVRAGKPFSLGFMVLQHGVSPVHDLGTGYPITPLIVATNVETGERVELTARPTEELGHFAVEITLPVEGIWEWSITPRPFGQQELAPLTVLPTPQAAPVGSLFSTGDGQITAVTLRWAGAGLAALGLVAFFRQRRRMAPPVQADA